MRTTLSSTACESSEAAECKPDPFIAKLLDRLLSRCVGRPCAILETQCWEYTGALCNKGYAHWAWWDPVQKRRFWKRGHIWLWELVTGRKVRPGHTLDHRCLNTRCVRPDHLEEITRAKNTARGNRTRHGHPAEVA